MKKLLIILFLIPFICQAQIKPDKYKHALAGSSISGVTFALGKCSKRGLVPWAPTVLAATAGYTKEMIDSFSGRQFSGSDFLWTAASGVVTNIALYVIFDRKKHKQKTRKEIEFIEDLPLTKKQ